MRAAASPRAERWLNVVNRARNAALSSVALRALATAARGRRRERLLAPGELAEHRKQPVEVAHERSLDRWMSESLAPDGHRAGRDAV